MNWYQSRVSRTNAESTVGIDRAEHLKTESEYLSVARQHINSLQLHHEEQEPGTCIDEITDRHELDQLVTARIEAIVPKASTDSRASPSKKMVTFYDESASNGLYIAPTSAALAAVASNTQKMIRPDIEKPFGTTLPVLAKIPKSSIPAPVRSVSRSSTYEPSLRPSVCTRSVYGIRGDEDLHDASAQGTWPNQTSSMPNPTHCDNLQTPASSDGILKRITTSLRPSKSVGNLRDMAASSPSKKGKPSQIKMPPSFGRPDPRSQHMIEVFKNAQWKIKTSATVMGYCSRANACNWNIWLQAIAFYRNNNEDGFFDCIEKLEALFQIYAGSYVSMR